MLSIILSIASGATVGALSRYGIAVALSHVFAPAGTLMANMIGCFGMGVVWVVFDQYQVSDVVRMGVLVGFFGSLTTFSTFSFEVFKMLSQQQWWVAVGYVGVSNLVGVVLMGIGMWVGRFF